MAVDQITLLVAAAAASNTSQFLHHAGFEPRQSIFRAIIIKYCGLTLRRPALDGDASADLDSTNNALSDKQ